MTKTAEINCHAYLSRVVQTVSPSIVPLDDLSGVCTQVDHLLATQREAIREAEARGRAEGYEAGARDMRWRIADCIDWDNTLQLSSEQVVRLRRYIFALPLIGGKAPADEEQP